MDEAGMVGFAEFTVKRALEGYSAWGAVQKVLFSQSYPCSFSNKYYQNVG
jgi:hypothetical protein